MIEDQFPELERDSKIEWPPIRQMFCKLMGLRSVRGEERTFSKGDCSASDATVYGAEAARTLRQAFCCGG